MHYSCIINHNDLYLHRLNRLRRCKDSEKYNNTNMKDEMKKWQTKNNEGKVCFYLMTRRVAFSYTEKTGIVFEASASFVKHMSDALVMAYGCTHKLIINEMK